MIWEVTMSKLRTYSLGKACIALSLLALAGCGANTMMMNSNRVLQMMTVTPPVADGQNFAMGQLQFTAMVTFSRPPSPAAVTFVAPFSGSWSVSVMNVATINQNEMALCMTGAHCTLTVMAQSSSNSALPGTI